MTRNDIAKSAQKTAGPLALELFFRREPSPAGWAMKTTGPLARSGLHLSTKTLFNALTSARKVAVKNTTKTTSQPQLFITLGPD